MRGKEAIDKINAGVNRITPAYAGKRFCFIFWKNILQDHPRLCGEKNSTAGNERRLVGSPPPMRGKVKKYIQFTGQ